MGEVGNLVSITALGWLINYLFKKPWLYEQRLLFLGVIGAVLGYTAGSVWRQRIQSAKIYWFGVIISFAAAVSLYIYYDRHLIQLTGKPPWYDYALFATFFALNGAAFCGFALLGLKFIGKGSNGSGDGS